MIGRFAAWAERRAERLGNRRRLARSRTETPATWRSMRGFTLLELMIVMFIIIILVTVALPQYQHYVLRARETVLKDDLTKMRTLIDQYAADKTKLPKSLQELVDAGYMREIPKDPITDEATWQEVMGDDPNSSKGEQGLIDVHSLSTDTTTSTEPNKDTYDKW